MLPGWLDWYSLLFVWRWDWRGLDIFGDCLYHALVIEDFTMAVRMLLRGTLWRVSRVSSRTTWLRSGSAGWLKPSVWAAASRLALSSDLCLKVRSRRMKTEPNWAESFSYLALSRMSLRVVSSATLPLALKRSDSEGIRTTSVRFSRNSDTPSKAWTAARVESAPKPLMTREDLRFCCSWSSWSSSRTTFLYSEDGGLQAGGDPEVGAQVWSELGGMDDWSWGCGAVRLVWTGSGWPRIRFISAFSCCTAEQIPISCWDRCFTRLTRCISVLLVGEPPRLSLKSSLHLVHTNFIGTCSIILLDSLYHIWGETTTQYTHRLSVRGHER